MNQNPAEMCADGKEHEFRERGYAGLQSQLAGPFGDYCLGVWWWECACGLHVWHQRGSLERGILAGHFVRKEDAPKEFDREA